MTEDEKPTPPVVPTTPEGTTEGTPEENPEDKTQSTSLIDIANAAAERMEKANEETGRLQKEREEYDAKLALGGKSEAGKETNQEFTPEQQESRKRIKAVADVANSEWGKKYE